MDNFLAIFYLLTALVWLWRARRSLEALKKIPQVRPAAPPTHPCPRVSFLLPVKNEEANLPNCLQGLLAQDYPSQEIIVINDHSLDRTGEILTEFTQLYPQRIQVVNAETVPAGWTGKNWALAQGTKLARGEWFLFTDADTRHEPWSISSAVSHAEGKDLDFLSLTPRCLAQSFWEKAVQPAAMGLLGLWFPLDRVNDPFSPAVFGNGQYLLIRKKVYETIGGHEKVKGEFLEDFGLVQEAKQASLRVEIAIGTNIYGTRMYRTLAAIWLGWRRIYFHAFRKQPWTLLGKGLSVFLFSFLPFFLFPFLTEWTFHFPDEGGRLWGASFPILSLVFLTAWKTHEVIGARRAFAFLHPLAGLVLTGILFDSAWTAFQKREVRWR